jgi:hypothetical protein
MRKAAVRVLRLLAVDSVDAGAAAELDVCTAPQLKAEAYAIVQNSAQDVSALLVHGACHAFLAMPLSDSAKATTDLCSLYLLHLVLVHARHLRQL